MQFQDTARSGAPEVQQAVEQRILQRTWGRIHRLHVELSDGRLVVHGCTSSYYSKQLALQAALEVLDSTDATCVELDVEVGDTHRHTTRRPYNGLWPDTSSDF